VKFIAIFYCGILVFHTEKNAHASNDFGELLDPGETIQVFEASLRSLMKDGLQRPKSQIKLHPLKAQDSRDNPIQWVQFLIVRIISIVESQPSSRCCSIKCQSWKPGSKYF